MSLRHRCALLLLILATGCYRWLPLPGAGLAHPEKEELGRVTVWLRNGTGIELDDASIAPDSIVGVNHETSARLAIVRSDIDRVDTRNPDPFLSFVTGVFVAGVAVLYMVLASSRT